MSSRLYSMNAMSSAETTDKSNSALNIIFTLKEELTKEQVLFLHTYGFLNFRGALSPDEARFFTDHQERFESKDLKKSSLKTLT